MSTIAEGRHTTEAALSPAVGIPARRGRVGIIVALSVFGGLVLIAIIAPFFLQDPNLQLLGDALKPPSLHGGHLLGTDNLGEDELSRLASGLRTSLKVAFSSVLIGGTVGTIVGTISGYFGGLLDELVMRLADVQLSIPAVLLAITLVSALHPSTLTVILVLSLYAWVIFARVARAQVLAFRSTDLVLSIRSMGASTPRILVRHVVPNIASPLMALATAQLANLIIIEAALSYLGIGVPPPTPTIGQMIAGAQTYLTTGQWWLTVNPAVVLALLVISINFIGDWLRDQLDPRGRSS